MIIRVPEESARATVAAGEISTDLDVVTPGAAGRPTVTPLPSPTTSASSHRSLSSAGEVSEQHLGGHVANGRGVGLSLTFNDAVRALRITRSACTTTVELAPSRW